MPYQLVRIPVRIVVERWVDSNLTRVDDSDGDDNEIMPELGLFDGCVLMTPEDGDRLYHWIEQGYYPVVLINKP